MQLEIKTTIDALNPNHVKALNAFLTGIGAAAGAVAKVSEALEPIEEKPKQTRKKAEKVETQEEYIETQKGAIEAQVAEKVEAIEVVESETVSAITLFELRELVKPKAAAHREDILLKLKELNATAVSNLDPKHYETLSNFLTAL